MHHARPRGLQGRCAAGASARRYAFVANGYSKDELRVDNDDTLRAQLPLGLARFRSEFEKHRRLRFSLALVGRYTASVDIVRADALSSPGCAGATHFVHTMCVGASSDEAAANAGVGGGVEAPGAGAAADSKYTSAIDKRDGDLNACLKATADDNKPPTSCSKILKLEVKPIAPKLAQPSCPPWHGLRARRHLEGHGRHLQRHGRRTVLHGRP